MEQKVVFITGASSGIGFSTTEFLLDKGFIVYAGARRTEKLKPLQEKGAIVFELDVRNPESIDSAIQTILEKEGRIDAVFANAGYGVQGCFEAVDIEDAKAEFETNVFGLARTFKAALPHMRKQKSGKLIACSSIVGTVSVPGMPWYPASKHAVEGLCDALRMEVKEFGIDVVKIQPGYIKTEFADVAFTFLDKAIKADPEGVYHEKMENFKHNFNKALNESGADPETIAKAVFDAIESDNPKRAYRVNGDAKQAHFLKSTFGDAAIDKIMPMMVFKKH